MPNQFTPVTTTDQKAALNQINNNFRKLDAESVTKSFGSQSGSDKLLIGKTGDETLGMAYKKDGEDKIVFGKLPDGTYGLIFYDAFGVPSIYMVIDASGKPVLKVAKEGKNAQTGSDNDLIFNSSQNVFKIAKIIAGDAPALSIPYNNNTISTVLSTTIPHGLGYIPALIAYVNANGTSYQQTPISYYTALSGGFGRFTVETVDVSVDATNVYLAHTLLVSDSASGTATRPVAPVKVYLLQESAS